jgi:hypothetical protein
MAAGASIFRLSPPVHSKKRIFDAPKTYFPHRNPMSTATTTEPMTGQHTTSRSTTNPTTQTSPNAAQRLRTTMAAVKLAFTWLGVRKTLAPVQRTTAARAFHADRELLSAGRHQLDRG